MAASYPTSVKSFTTKQDNVDTIQASHINDLQDEVVAIETHLMAIQTHLNDLPHLNDLKDEVVAIQTHLNDLQDKIVAIETGWQSYTPEWSSTGTAPTLGNGTLAGRYVQIGRLVLFSIEFTFGSTSNGGTGQWRFSLPVEGSAPVNPVAVAVAVDVSAGASFPAAALLDTTTARFIPAATGTIPWASGDTLRITGWYVKA